MENTLDEILEYYGQTKTVFDIKRMRKSLSIAQFAVETFVHLHVMTCVQIILCTHRDFSVSWMGAQGVD